MTFVIRSSSTSAAGREIVRTREIAGDTVVIGRDPASDIHLTDLEVTHRHAVVRRIGPRQVTVEAVAELPILVDGRSTKAAELDAGHGGEIRVGGARIGLSTEGEAIVLAVARAEAPTAARDAARAFSIAGTLPGKRPMAWIAALLVLALFLAWPIWSFVHPQPRLTPAQMASGHYRHIDASWSAGPLSVAHAGLAHDCKACHVGAFVAVKDATCKGCHAAAHDHADPRRLAIAMGRPAGIEGLKRRIATIFGRDPGRCVDCHLEHQGASSVLGLSGATCVDCHAAMDRRLTDTRLANAGDFATGHPQFRPLVTTRPADPPAFARMSLDRPVFQDDGLRFPHAMHMSRMNGVARMQQSLGLPPMRCASCHAPGDSEARFLRVSMERNCQACHSLAFDRVGGTVRTLRHGEPAQVIADIRDVYAAHPGGGVAIESGRRRPGEAGLPGYHAAIGGAGGAATAIRAVFSRGGACYDCHVVIPPSRPGGLDYGIAPVRQALRYLRHGWFDHAAHANETCESCHGQALRSNDARLVMLPGIATCRACHGGAHATAPLVRSSCETCHDYHRGDGAPRATIARVVASAQEGDPLRLAWEGDGRVDRADFGPASRLRTR